MNGGACGNRSTAGLTLIEVLLAIVMLGISIPLLLVSVQRGLAVARRATHLENVRRLAGALDVDYAVDWDEGPEPFRSGVFEAPFDYYRWEREIEPALDPDLPLYRVTTRIFWAEPSRDRDGGETWVTLRYVPDEDGGTFDRREERP